MSKYEAEIEKLLADDSFVAWIEGRSTQEEANEWERWLKDDPARKQSVEQARLLHRKIEFDAAQRPEVERELTRLNEAVDQFETSKNRGKEIKVSRINRKKTYSSVAAVMLLLVAVVSVITLFQADLYPSETTTSKFLTKSTRNGEKKILTLSDGSVITLNANSSLKYPSQYSGGNVEVWLEGEAYFDIVHKTGSDKRTFSVNVPGGRVKVLGTEFNVNTYEEATEVVLVQGRVNVEMRDTLSQIKDSYVMEPGELSQISGVGGGIITRKVETDLYTAWTRDKLVLDHTPLTKVAERFEHIYGVQFQLNGYNLKEIVVSGSLPNNNLNVFLNALENMLDRPVTNKGGLIIFGEQKSDHE